MILPEFFDSCDFCEEPFERDTTYPVLTTDDESSGMRLYSFCDDACLSSWRESDDSVEKRDGTGAKA